MKYADDPVFGRLWKHAPHALRAVMAAPDQKRGQLALVFALDVEFYMANQASNEDMINAIKLAWWKEAIDGLPDGADRHELLGVILAEELPTAMAARMIAAYQSSGDGLRVLVANAAQILGADADGLNALIDQIAEGDVPAQKWDAASRPVVIFLRKFGPWAAMRMRLSGR